MFDILAIQRFYPQVFDRLMPFASNIVDRYGGHRTLTERDINRMVDELLFVSNVRQFPPRGFSHSSIVELARLLILINLYNRGYIINPFWALYFGHNSRFLLRPLPPLRPIPIAPPRPEPIRPIRPIPIAPPGPMPIDRPMVINIPPSNPGRPPFIR